ncbi:MAG: cobalamin biosynthesis protein CbiA [Thermodesulfobacteriota bacterium]
MTGNRTHTGAEISLEGVVIIVGNYGSGKTEIAVNLAVHQKKAGMEVRIADLDLVNPYFRMREARDLLEKWGIGLVLPPVQYLQADLPILDRAVSGMIRNPGQISILDVGGDPVGAAVLAALSDAFRSSVSHSIRIHMLQVVNPFRPFTETIEKCRKMKEAIEKASKLSVTGIIGNPNLMDETTVQNLMDGYDFIAALSREIRIPVEFMAVSGDLLSQVGLNRFLCPVLTISRQMVPPWKRAENI